MSGQTRREFIQRTGSGVALAPSVPGMLAPVRVLIAGEFPKDRLAKIPGLKVVKSIEEADALIFSEGPMPPIPRTLDTYWVAELPETPQQLAQAKSQLKGGQVEYALTLSKSTTIQALQESLLLFKQWPQSIRYQVVGSEAQALTYFIDFLNLAEPFFPPGGPQPHVPTHTHFSGGLYSKSGKPDPAVQLWIGNARSAHVDLEYQQPLRLSYSFRASNQPDVRKELQVVLPQGMISVRMTKEVSCRFVRPLDKEVPDWIANTMRVLQSAAKTDNPEERHFQAWVDTVRPILPTSIPENPWLGPFLKIAGECRPAKQGPIKRPKMPNAIAAPSKAKSGGH